MTQNPKISIIIPIYNVAQYISNSLVSALNQTYTPIEYIAIDDCSTDNSISIVNEIIQMPQYCTKDFKLLRHAENRGLSAARNTGMQNASGDYIFFMDSDDEITPRCIELHYHAIKEVHADFTIANIQLVGAKSLHIQSINDKALEMSSIESYFKKMWSVSAWNKLYSMRFLRDNNLWFKEDLIHEDILWSYLVAKSSTRLASVKEATYIYKIRNNSITTSVSNPKKIGSLISILDEISNYDQGDHVALKRQFVSFWKFNTALLLLNFRGTTIQKKALYNAIRSVDPSCSSIYDIILNVPLWLFSVIFYLPYTLYKYFQRL